MIKRLLFPTGAFLILVLSVALSPQPARAGPCNNKVCVDLGDGIDGCLPATGGPSTQCGDSETSCIWDWCTPV